MTHAKLVFQVTLNIVVEIIFKSVFVTNGSTTKRSKQSSEYAKLTSFVLCPFVMRFLAHFDVFLCRKLARS